MIKVIFKIEKEGNDVFAFFPEESFTYNHKDFHLPVYSHKEQHSFCDREYANDCKEAKYEEYKDLYNEMTNEIGYKLEVLNKDFRNQK